MKHERSRHVKFAIRPATSRLDHSGDGYGPIWRRAGRAPLAAALLVTSFASACSETPVSPETAGVPDPPHFTVGAGPVIQHVSVGSNDLCPALGQPPGCDANFSLVASKWADGRVRGQWQDRFGKDSNGDPLGGIHVAIDCLEVEQLTIGIYTFAVAWVSGVVTASSSPQFAVGDGAITGAVDRGTSANDLFEDLASFSFPLSSFPAGTTCASKPNLPVFLGVGYTGQVDIWFR